MSSEPNKRAYFSLPAPPPSQFRHKSTAQALSPTLIFAIAILSSVLFFAMAIFLPGARLTLIFTGLSIAFLTSFILFTLKKYSQRQALKKGKYKISNIEIFQGKLQIPNYLKYPPQKVRERTWQEEFSIFTLPNLLDFEVVSGSKNTPRTFLFETKVHGKKQKFQFVNPFGKREEESFVKALKDSLPESHHLFSPEAQSLRKQKIGAHVAAVIALSMGVFVIFIPMVIFPPLLYYTSLAHLFLYSLAPSLFAAVVLRKTVLTHLFDEGYGRELSFLLFAPSVWVLFAMGLQLGNLFLPSESLTQEVPIIDRFKKRSKSSNRYYLAFPTPTAGSYLFQFNERSSFSVSKRVYSKVRIQQDRYRLKINEGFFLLPYVTRKLRLPTFAGDLKKQKKKPRSRLRRLRAWKAPPPNFPKRPEYRFEYWDNKQLKAKEPQLGGLIHGIAYYYHENGETYSVIPWVKGKKQGRYKTYRKDGSLEGSFSVKEGRLHGLNLWYNRKGKLRQAVIYDNGEALSSKKF